MASRNRVTRWLLVAMIMAGGIAEAQTVCRVACWNVENLFDTYNDTLTADDAFIPQGSQHWTEQRLRRKINGIYKTLMAMGGTASAFNSSKGLNMPVVVGMVEVENAAVLRRLCNGTPLRNYGYQYLHYDSPDARGIDCALLYRPDRYQVVSSKAVRALPHDTTFRSRDFLLVTGVLDNSDTLVLIVNHWPSKRGGAAADYHRMGVARQLYTMIDTLTANHPNATVLAMGDFNSEPHEPPLTQVMGFADSLRNSRGWYHLATLLPHSSGTYCYQHQWTLIDLMVLAGNCSLTSTNATPSQSATATALHTDGMHIFAPSFMLQTDSRALHQQPSRTYLGMRYIGGYSDHLPIYIDMWRP